MNASVPFPLSLADAHDAATNEVNRWRGHCLDLYARIERDCIEAIDAMIASGRMPELRRKSLFGARIDAVRKGLESCPLDKPPKALKALGELDEALGRRNDIVHGIGKVWIDANDNWQWQFAYLSNAKGQGSVSGHFTSHEALILEKGLSAGAQSLRDTLRNFKRELKEMSVTE